MSLPAAVTPPYLAAQINVRGRGGVVDQTAEVQKALDLVKGLSYNYGSARPVGRIPEIVIHGECGISSGLNFHHAGPLTIRGSSPNSGFRAIAAGTYDMLTIGDGSAGGYGSYVNIRDLGFYSTGQKTGGAAIRLHTASSVRINTCTIWHQYDGIVNERGSQQNTVHNCNIFLFSRYGIRQNVSATDQATYGYGSEGHYVDNFIYSGLSGGGGLGAGCIGIFHEGGDATHYRSNHVVACGVGMLVKPTYTPNPEVGHNSIIDNIISDNQVDCLVLDGTDFATSKWVVTDNHLVYSLVAGVGLRLIGNSLKDINVRGNIITSNTSGGIYLGSGPRDILIDGNIIGRNGTAGIITQSGAQGFRIINNRCSNNTSGGVGYTQAHGISWGGTHENYIYAHNDLRGNGTAATTGTPGGSNKIDTPNLT